MRFATDKSSSAFGTSQGAVLCQMQEDPFLGGTGIIYLLQHEFAIAAVTGQFSIWESASSHVNAVPFVDPTANTLYNLDVVISGGGYIAWFLNNQGPLVSATIPDTVYPYNLILAASDSKNGETMSLYLDWVHVEVVGPVVGNAAAVAGAVVL